ncbi:MAG: glycosyl hydrolase family 8 [Thermodesulfobacteriota bacterium]
MLKTGSVGLLVFFLSFCSYSYAQDTLWQQYTGHFVSDEGRVIDYYQGSVSHSEGQGYGMLLAVLNDDKPAFDKIWQWTKNNLCVRKDNLLAWLWGKRQNGEWKVIDYNNATDGDILVAFALLRAQKKWGAGSYDAEALKIIKAIRKEVAFSWQGRIFLLPGYYGFAVKDGAVISPSYFVFPAYKLFAEVDDKSFWEKVYGDAKFFLSRAVFSSYRLPSDWVSLSNSDFSISKERSVNFGYEAIRVPLYLSMEENHQFPEGINALPSIYKKNGYVPLWVRLTDGAVSSQQAPAGFYAVYSVVEKKNQDEALAKELFEKAKEKLLGEKDDYYSFTLYLLAKGDSAD